MLKKILILALGGEGGGTLTEWVVAAGTASGWPIQATSVPGVAQRTGGTSYYIECLTRPLATGEQAPPMCLAPLAGDLDLIISSELLETARAIERGLADPQRTAVISSSARALTVDERVQMGDGRMDSAALQAAIGANVARFSLLDLSALAKAEGTVVSAVMFGALCAEGVLPFERAICEQVIGSAEAGSRGAASLRGFASGYAALSRALSRARNQAHSAGQAPDLGAHPQIAERDARGLDADQVIALGQARLTDYQDAAYAKQYQQRVDAIRSADQGSFEVTREAARYLARWMAYEDIIRVADLKSRRERFEQIRANYAAKPGEPVLVHDFLKPGIEEIAAILPPALAARVVRWAERRSVVTVGAGMQLRTSSVTGLLLMRLLANLRFMRRASSRFQQEHQLIERWLKAMQRAQSVPQSRELQLEIACLPRLIKGYGDTFARGRANFVRILETLLEPALEQAQLDAGALAGSLRAASQAALASPDGQALFDALGLSRPPLKEHPIKFMRPLPGKAPAR